MVVYGIIIYPNMLFNSDLTNIIWKNNLYHFRLYKMRNLFKSRDLKICYFRIYAKISYAEDFSR